MKRVQRIYLKRTWLLNILVTSCSGFGVCLLLLALWPVFSTYKNGMLTTESLRSNAFGALTVFLILAVPVIGLYAVTLPTLLTKFTTIDIQQPGMMGVKIVAWSNISVAGIAQHSIWGRVIYLKTSNVQITLLMSLFESPQTAIGLIMQEIPPGTWEGATE